MAVELRKLSEKSNSPKGADELVKCNIEVSGSVIASDDNFLVKISFFWSTAFYYSRY